MANDPRERLESDGFASLDERADFEQVERLRAELTPLLETLSEHERRGGLREVFARSEAARAIANSLLVRTAVESVLGQDAFAVRALFFDKTPGANWKVIWHQDLTIAVREQREVDGFGAWSHKGGAQHVQAPAWLLERMLAVRIHLDDCGEDAGPLRVLPGSHRHGRLDAEQIADWRLRGPARSCLLPCGGVLLMRPLLLHASSPARTPSHRRVLHLEFARDPLPGGLRWRERRE
jgi:ectoine hydroxylase-related dioxygenase (phytanoyl-CoA dioxygenase family)